MSSHRGAAVPPAVRVRWLTVEESAVRVGVPDGEVERAIRRGSCGLVPWTREGLARGG